MLLRGTENWQRWLKSVGVEGFSPLCRMKPWIDVQHQRPSPTMVTKCKGHLDQISGDLPNRKEFSLPHYDATLEPLDGSGWSSLVPLLPEFSDLHLCVFTSLAPIYHHILTVHRYTGLCNAQNSSIPCGTGLPSPTPLCSGSFTASRPSAPQDYSLNEPQI